jgi:hypothetical protein
MEGKRYHFSTFLLLPRSSPEGGVREGGIGEEGEEGGGKDVSCVTNISFQSCTRSRHMPANNERR